MNVLYLHAAAAFSGASKSLSELFRHLHSAGVNGTVLTPAGASNTDFTNVGMSIRTVRGLCQFDNTRYGHYRRLRWLIVLRELFLLPFAVRALWQLRHEPFDLIHINELPLLPLGILAKRLLGVPLVVHVRSLQRLPGSGWRTAWVNRALHRHADAVVAIDHTVASTLPPDLPLHIIHNGLKINVTAPTQARRDGPVRVGFMGTLVPLKGIYELVEAMRLLKERGVAVECLIAGENVRELSGPKAWLLRRLGFARNVRAELEALIAQYGLQAQVKLLGFVRDVHTIYPQLDILCFPSHLDAAGRPVFEAAFYGVPSVVAVSNPLPDGVMHGQTGLAIPRPEPELIADALQRLAEDTPSRLSMGENARRWAYRHFAIEGNANLMLTLYQHILSEK